MSCIGTDEALSRAEPIPKASGRTAAIVSASGKVSRAAAEVAGFCAESVEAAGSEELAGSGGLDVGACDSFDWAVGNDFAVDDMS